MSIQALREQLSHHNREANAILAAKGAQTWAKEDQAKFDEHMESAERTQRQIEAHQRMLDQEAENNFRDVPRDKSGKKASLTEGQIAINAWLRKKDSQYSDEEALAIRNTMSTTTGSEGGFTVQSAVAASVIEAIKSYGSMRRVAQSINTSMGNDLSYPTSDGTSEVGEIVAQNTLASDADISFGSRALNVYKFGSKVITVPIELLQDSEVDIEALVRGRIQQRIGRVQNQYFTTGTGTGQPTGLAVAASVGKTGTTGQTTTIIYDDLVDIVDSMDVAYTDEAAAEPQFMFNQTLRRTLRKLKDTAGRPIWTPSYDQGIAGERADRLLDYPVVINNDMPTPAANAKSLAFGQLGRYVVRDVMAITLFRFDDSKYAARGQVGFLAWTRAGGNLMDLSGVRLYQHSAT